MGARGEWGVQLGELGDVTLSVALMLGLVVRMGSKGSSTTPPHSGASFQVLLVDVERRLLEMLLKATVLGCF